MTTHKRQKPARLDEALVSWVETINSEHAYLNYSEVLRALLRSGVAYYLDHKTLLATLPELPGPSPGEAPAPATDRSSSPTGVARGRTARVGR